MMRFNLLISNFLFVFLLTSCVSSVDGPIDREALVKRNNPIISTFDPMASLSVGNGEFAITVDATGLQTFPELYTNGVPLGTQSQWGWHSFPNTENFSFEETLVAYNFTRGREELYPVQFNERGRQQDAANYFRANPHRLHLGIIGLELSDPEGKRIDNDGITEISQTLNMWDGMVNSHFKVINESVEVSTVCHPEKDMFASSIKSSLLNKGNLAVNFRFPYPTGRHSDDAMDWSKPDLHSTSLLEKGNNFAIFQRTLDATVYFVKVVWQGSASIIEKAPHYYILQPGGEEFSFTCSFQSEMPTGVDDGYDLTSTASSGYWQNFWKSGAAVDFSAAKDPRAAELERRVVLSQYLMAIQSSGSLPPQETGLTYNSWFGKLHLEMHWWHAAHFALWNRIELLERSMDWYTSVYPIARQIAERQGFDGVRWMKMTDPSGGEAPSGVGSFIIWQQPHYIYFSELIYRERGTQEIIDKYKYLVFETAEFMASFASYEADKDRYVLKGAIPAQETLRASETVNPPFELSYWHYGLTVAQQWRERAGLDRKPEWDEVINKLSVLAAKDGLYLAAETAPETYEDIRFSSDHMSVLGAYGILPASRLVEPEIMRNTLNWVMDNWNWDKTWGWDYPMTAMSAARLGEPEKAVAALLMDKRTNTYLPNGHNYQDDRLRVYLPGNGGILSAVAMMCAGWDGSEEDTPGFPKDGKWNVKWEGLKRMP